MGPPDIIAAELIHQGDQFLPIVLDIQERTEFVDSLAGAAPANRPAKRSWRSRVLFPGLGSAAFTRRTEPVGHCCQTRRQMTNDAIVCGSVGWGWGLAFPPCRGLGRPQRSTIIAARPERESRGDRPRPPAVRNCAARKLLDRGCDNARHEARHPRFGCVFAYAARDCRRFLAPRIGDGDAGGYRCSFRRAWCAPCRYPPGLELLVCSGALHLFANHSRKGNSPRPCGGLYGRASHLVDRLSRHGRCDLALSEPLCRRMPARTPQ